MFRPSLSIFAHLLLVSKISLGSRSALHEIVIGNRTATGTFQLIFLNFQKYWLKLLIDYLPIFNTIFKILKSLKIFKALSFSWKHFHSNMSILSDEILKGTCKHVLCVHSSVNKTTKHQQEIIYSCCKMKYVQFDTRKDRKGKSEHMTQ